MSSDAPDRTVGVCVCVFDLPSEPDYKTMTNVKAAQSLGTCGRQLQHRSIFTRPAKEPNHGVEGLDSMEAARLAPVPARCMGQIGDCRLAKLPSAHHGIDHAAECLVNTVASGYVVGRFCFTTR